MNTSGLMEGIRMITIPAKHPTTPGKDKNWGLPWRTGWEEVASVTRKIGTINRMEGKEKIIRRIYSIANSTFV